jgi:hypothetical protein
MSWAAYRRTTRPEDEAYCLLGIFGINMPLLYGEGPNAFYRLQEEIIKRSTDQSILAWIEERGRAGVNGWRQMTLTPRQMLAVSPRAFPRVDEMSETCHLFRQPYTITNNGFISPAIHNHEQWLGDAHKLVDMYDFI